MNLDDPAAFSQVDPQNLLAEIEAFPEQLSAAWDLGQTLDLPAWEGIRQIVIAGMGTSAVAADLLAAYAAPICSLPVMVVRNYTLPAWANGSETLVLCTSYSGDTEEILSIHEQAGTRDCRVLAITTGGKLAVAASENDSALWAFEHPTRMGVALGITFGLLLAAFARLGLITDPADELSGALAALKAQQATLGAEIPIMQNEAKRVAGQCVGRWVAVFGSDHLEPVARYWKIQLNGFAKTWGHNEAIPEADHNALLGVLNPAQRVGQTMLLFLRSRGCHPRNQRRTKITKEYFMLEGLGTDFFNASGESRLAQMLTALHFGDYLAYYLGMAYGTDPNPLETVAAFKLYLTENG